MYATSKMQCCKDVEGKYTVIYSPQPRDHVYEEEGKEVLTEVEKDLLKDDIKILKEDEDELERTKKLLEIAEATVARLTEREINEERGRVARAAVRRLRASIKVLEKRVSERKRRIDKYKKKGFRESLREWKEKLEDEFEEAVKEAARDECKGMGATPELCEKTWLFHVDKAEEEVDGKIVETINY